MKKYSIIINTLLVFKIISGESGICSWYGVGLDGALTANGEKYNSNSMTAAHKTLPFGTIVTATCSSGKKVTVRINDRGPFVAGRILDLSIAAAKILDIYAVKGLCQCEVVTSGHINTQTPHPITLHPKPTTSIPIGHKTTEKSNQNIDCSVADKRYPDPKDCNKYYWCYGGTAHLVSCGAGTVWDPKRNLCDYLKNVNRPECK